MQLSSMIAHEAVAERGVNCWRTRCKRKNLPVNGASCSPPPPRPNDHLVGKCLENDFLEMAMSEKNYWPEFAINREKITVSSVEGFPQYLDTLPMVYICDVR